MEGNGNGRPQRDAEANTWPTFDSQADPGEPSTTPRHTASPLPEAQRSQSGPSPATDEDEPALSRLQILRGVFIGCITVVGLLIVGLALVNLMWYILFR